MTPVTTSPRAIVKAALAATGYPIVGSIPKNITDVTLVVGLAEVTPGPPQGQLTWKVTVLVLSAIRDEKSEDDLEAAVLAVVGALLPAELVALTGGTRGTAGDDAYNAFALEAEVYTPIT